MNTEVKMKTVTVCWSEKVYYNTVIDVPEDWTDSQIEESFWHMDLSGEIPLDSEYFRIEYIEDEENENVD